MFIIVEGVDCSGKSTLIEKLKDCLQIKSFNERYDGNWFNKIEDKNVRDITARYCLFLELSFANMFDYIIDRYHLSEIVYRNLENRNIDYFDELEEKILKIPHLLILCRPNFVNLLDKTIQRDSIVPTDLSKAYDLFDKHFAYSRLNKIIVKPY